MGSSRAVNYGAFDEVAVLRTMHGHSVGRNLTYAEAAEVVRRMTLGKAPIREIAERLDYHPRSVFRVRAAMYAREAAA